MPIYAYADLLFEQRIQADQQARLQNYKTWYEYYNGDHALPLKIKEGQENDNVIINLARLIVDKGASFLFGKDLPFELKEGATTPAEETLETIWKHNRKMTFLMKIAVSGGIYGHLFIKILPDGIKKGLPRLVNIEPEYLTVFYDEQDIESVWRYRIEWTALGHNGRAMHRRQDIELDDGGKRWQIINRIAESPAYVWKPDPQQPDLTWKWPWPPIIDCQNMIAPGQYYGLSDLEDLSEQNAINYLASKTQRIIRYHAHPKTIGTGFKATDVKHDEDDVMILPGSDSKLWNLEMKSNLSANIAFLDRLINLHLGTARIPRLDPAQINVGALSGFALKVLYGDLLEKTETKRRTYGDMLVELNRRLLEMAGKGADNYTTLHWQDPLPVDEAAENLRDGFDLDNKIASRETIQTKRGYKPETENERLEAEEAAEGNIGAAIVRGFLNRQGRPGTPPQGGA